MGHLFQKPLIIEFNGLPGAGKTTVANALQRRLEGMGVSTVTHYYRNIFHRKPQTLLMAPRYWKLIKASLSFAGLLSKRSYIQRILLMIKFVRMYRHFESDKPADCLLVDQGIIQGIVSIAHNEKLTRSDILENLIGLMHMDAMPLIFVNCNVSNETANERILSRPSNGCRVENMTCEERNRTLLIQSNNFYLIRETINEKYSSVSVVEVDNEEPVENAVDLIINHILPM